MGPFEGDLPHGKGTMHLRDRDAVPGNDAQADAVPFEFFEGKPQIG